MDDPGTESRKPQCTWLSATPRRVLLQRSLRPVPRPDVTVGFGHVGEFVLVLEMEPHRASNSVTEVKGEPLVPSAVEGTSLAPKKTSSARMGIVSRPLDHHCITGANKRAESKQVGAGSSGDPIGSHTKPPSDSLNQGRPSFIVSTVQLHGLLCPGEFIR